MWYFALCMEITYGITYGNYVSILFVIVMYFLFRHNYFIYFFEVVTFFDDVRNRYYFGTFELRMEITLQLRFVFVRHCNVFFITSQLRYLFVQCKYVFWWRSNYVIFWYVRITYRNYVIKWSFLVTFVCNQQMTKKKVIIA